MATTPRRRALAASAAAALVLLALPSSPAAAIPPTPESDFRDAIAALPCSSGPYTITVTQDISFSTTGDIVYACADDLTIESTPGSHFTIDGSAVANTRFLDASGSSGTITITDLAITGFDHEESGTSIDVSGGAIVAGGPVDINTSTFSSNSVTGTGSGVSVGGGAVYAVGAITTNASTFSGNTATSNADATGYAVGGALHSQDAVFDTNSSFTSNQAIAATAGATAWAGAVYAKATSGLDGSHFTSNSVTSGADARGGAVLVDTADLTTTGATFLSNVASGASGADGGAIAIMASGNVTVDGGSFSSNSATTTSGGAYGGAIASDDTADITAATVSGNSATTADGDTASGGGLYASNSYAIVRSTFSTNSASATTSLGSANVFGGGAMANTSGTVIASTFTGNTVNATASGGGQGVGAGAFAYYGLGVYDSTFVGNSATGDSSGEGGGAAAFGLELLNSTFTGNSADLGAQVIGLSVSEAGSVFADPHGGGDNCSAGGGMTSNGYNFSDDSSCISDASDFGVGSDPMLGALADNGGPTQTRLPKPGSPLIDAFTSSDCADLASSSFSDAVPVDQRGIARPAGACDVGAVEVLANQAFDVVTPSGTIHVTVYNASGINSSAYVDPSTFTPAAPASVSLPCGAFTFSVDVPFDGWTVTVVLDMPKPVNQFWKYQNGTWTKVTGAAITGGGTVVTYDLTDGGTGDADLTANSTIVDPAAGGVGASFTG